eukprot:gnl/Dysnectes_brevis/5835_a8652_492.p1 GENE.gnl/Dysnectes_brevis/5835_a8652_492~~gnl/Dysnectes_brevis/5835_a8652_492.p1  ORF type:complete len:596 (-),score=216.82 gnl/Dysnectes_brevis/5835_a8652_492:800-2587(-)
MDDLFIPREYSESSESEEVLSIVEFQRKQLSQAETWQKEVSAGLQRAMEEVYPDLQPPIRRYKRQLCALVLYSLFLALFTYIALASRTSDTDYFFEATIKDLLFEEHWVGNTIKRFDQVNDITEMFTWMNDCLFDQLYSIEYYNGKSKDPKDYNMLVSKLRMMGAPRIRTLRVMNNTCDVDHTVDSLLAMTDSCYGDWATANEDTASFGGATGDKWSWEYYTGEITFKSRLTRFPPSGFGVVLSLDREEALATVEELKQSLFVDPATRCLLIEFTLYNHAISKYAVVTASFEMTATGSILPFAQVASVSFSTAVDQELSNTVVYWLFVACVVFQIAFEAHQLITTASVVYLSDVWNWLDLINLVLFMVAICLRALGVILVEENGALTNMTQSDSYIDYRTAAFFVTLERNINAVNLWLCWFKAFSYLSFFPALSQFIATLAKAGSDLFNYFIIVLIILVGYALSAYVAYGSVLYPFRSFSSAFYGMFQMFLGEADATELYKANRVFGPLMYVSFMVIGFMIMSEFAVSLLTDAYDAVRQSLANTGDGEVAEDVEEERNDQRHHHDGADSDSGSSTDASSSETDTHTLVHIDPEPR